MSNVAGGSHPQAPWLVLGPRSQGRNYGVVGRTAGLRLDRKAENRLEDFALALAAWADVAAASDLPRHFACLFQLGDSQPWLLARARYIGRSGLGTVAFAQGVLIGQSIVARYAIDTASLAALLPEPDAEGSPPPSLDLAAAGVVAPIGQRRPAGTLGTLAGVLRAWTLAIENLGPEGHIEILRRCLSSGHAPDRLVGWCDTGALRQNGAFDPASDFDLIVHAPGDGPARTDLARRGARVAAGKVIWKDIPPAPALAVWDALMDAAAQLDVSSPLTLMVWRREYSTATVAEIISQILRAVSRDGDPVLALQTFELLALATGRLEDEPEIQAEARSGLSEVFRGMIPAEPRAAAPWIDTYVARIAPKLGDVMPRMVTVEALDRRTLPYLQPATLMALGARGLLTTMAGRTLEALHAAVEADMFEGGLANEGLAALMDGLMAALQTSDADLDSHRLAAACLDEAAGRLLSSDGEGDALQQPFEDLLRRMVCDQGHFAELALGRRTGLAIRRGAALGRKSKAATGFGRLAQATLRAPAGASSLMSGLGAALGRLGVTTNSPWGAAA